MRRRPRRTTTADVHLRPGHERRARPLRHDRPRSPRTPRPPGACRHLSRQDGAPLPNDVGPSASSCPGANVNQIADGHLMVKWVSKVTLRGADAEWKVKMFGLSAGRHAPDVHVRQRRRQFDSCASPGCHGSRGPTPPPPRRGAACPCSCCVGQVDGGKGHGGYGAYNEALALRGYRVKLSPPMASTPSSAADHPQPQEHPARQQDDGLRPDREQYYPLKLVGPVKYVPGSKFHRPDQQDLPAAQVSRPVLAKRVRL